MKLRHLAAAASLALAACAPTNQSAPSEQENITPESEDDLIMPNKFRMKTYPKRRYEITMTIKNAPGMFNYLDLSAAYKADCWYVVDKTAETLGQPDHLIELDFEKIDEFTYRSEVYLDAITDEDYYGSGICHWWLTSVTVGLKKNGTQSDVIFSPFISGKEVVNQGSATRFFWKNRYFQEKGHGAIYEYGDKNLDPVPTDRRSEFFSITLTSREAQPWALLIRPKPLTRQDALQTCNCYGTWPSSMLMRCSFSIPCERTTSWKKKNQTSTDSER